MCYQVHQQSVGYKKNVCKSGRRVLPKLMSSYYAEYNNNTPENSDANANIPTL